jgi:hypothetical protein
MSTVVAKPPKALSDHRVGVSAIRKRQATVNGYINIVVVFAVQCMSLWHGNISTTVPVVLHHNNGT